MIKLITFCSLLASTQALSCYSCSNCDGNPQELATCGSEDKYCLTFQMYFVDYVTHKGCVPSCAPERLGHIYELLCCKESGCNGTKSIYSTSNSSFLTFLVPLISQFLVKQIPPL